MPKKQSLQTDITIAGLPIGHLERITPETVKVLKSARVILDLTGNPSLMKKFCARVINLDDVYWTGEVDEEVYTRIANIVLDQAKDGPGVALVVDGHPGIYQDLTWDIRDRGRRRGLKVVILPAISFLDLMIAFCDLKVDASGLLLLDATSIVAYGYDLYPHVDTLVLQIGWFGTSLLVDIEEHKKGRFDPLVKYLCKYYPENHVVRLIRAPVSADEKPTIIKTKLSSLDRFHKKITTDMTMLIPAIGDTDEGTDEEFVRQTTNTDHLKKIARI